MTKTALCASAAALVFYVGSASAETAPPRLSNVGSKHHAQLFISASKDTTLYDQNNHDFGLSAVSDDFDSGFDTYDSEAADDFTVPKNTTWTISEIDVTGVYFNGPGPADQVDVNIYAADKNAQLPTKLIASFPKSKFKDKSGSFAIKLKNAPALKSGTYFISVVAAMNRSGGAGEWGWKTASIKFGFGDPAAWQNPKGGFGVCGTWWRLVSCTKTAPDLMFALKGKAS